MSKSKNAKTHIYTYRGEPFIWDERGLGMVKVETSAVSLAKARANISYKIKQMTGLAANIPMKLYGSIKMRDDDGKDVVVYRL